MTNSPEPPVRFAVVGLNHSHIYMQVECMQTAGGHLVAYYSAEDDLAASFGKAFPEARRVSELSAILEDPSVRLVLTAAVPSERAGIALRAMRHGKDVMTDKPGATTLDQLAELRRVQAETGRIFSVYYEGRLENRATTLACNLVSQGAIGRFVHLTSLAPHAIRREDRPAWFFQPQLSGGILADLATHSCDQFLLLAGTLDVEVAFAREANWANEAIRAFTDFGEMCLSGPDCSAYFRLDWLSPPGLPVYGDGRMFIVGTEGSIEVRECIDLGRDTSEAVFLVDRSGVHRMKHSGTELPYGRQLVADILERTETAMSQAHCFKATELALQAESKARQFDDETPRARRNVAAAVFNTAQSDHT
jgi:predicted dehydrogenase